MIRTFRAEWVKFRRRRVVVTSALATIVFAGGTAAIVLSSAEASSNARARTSLASLAEAGGGTEVFTAGASFAGTFLFVVFVGITAAEFSRGTMRTMLLRQPR